MPADVKHERDEPRPVRGNACMDPWKRQDAAEEHRERRRLEAEERRLLSLALALGLAMRAEQERETRAP